MRIINYRTIIGEDNRTCLVKESAKNFTAYDKLDTPKKISELMTGIYELDKQAVEYVYLVAMDNRYKVLGVYEVSKGTVNTSLLPPREIYLAALLMGAVNIIVVHNHPSGDATPSKEDIENTRKLKEAGKLIEINFCDHIIVARDGYYSMREATIF